MNIITQLNNDYEKMRGRVKEIYDLKVQGYTDRNIAKCLGVSYPSFSHAIQIEGVVKDIYESAMEILAGKLMNVVVGRALGTDGRVDKDGEPIPADSNLAMRLLEKIDPRFRQKEEQKVAITIEQVIRKINGVAYDNEGAGGQNNDGDIKDAEIVEDEDGEEQ